jgi:hypothetical protein
MTCLRSSPANRGMGHCQEVANPLQIGQSALPLANAWRRTPRYGAYDAKRFRARRP